MWRKHLSNRQIGSCISAMDWLTESTHSLGVPLVNLLEMEMLRLAAWLTRPLLLLLLRSLTHSCHKTKRNKTIT